MGRPCKYKQIEQITLSLDKDLLKRLNKAAYTINLRDDKDLSRTDLIRTWLEERLNEEKL